MGLLWGLYSLVNDMEENIDNMNRLMNIWYAMEVCQKKSRL